MAQFTDAQMVTVRTAIEFLAETQRAHHGHVADDVQAVFDLFNPTFVEAAPAVEVAAPVAEEKPAKAKKVEAEETAE